MVGFMSVVGLEVLTVADLEKSSIRRNAVMRPVRGLNRDVAKFLTPERGRVFLNDSGDLLSNRLAAIEVLENSAWSGRAALEKQQNCRTLTMRPYSNVGRS
jgi:hypothetical protein